MDAGAGVSRGPVNTLGPGTGEDTLPSPPPPPGTRARPVSEAETPSNSLKVNLPRGERRGKGAGGGVCVWKACVKFQPLMTRGGKVPGPWERRQGEGRRGGRDESDRTREPRGAPRVLRPEEAGGAGAAGGEGALREPPEPRGAQASSAIHSCTEARAELLIAAIVTRGRCGSRASTLARDKWPLTAPPRQESSSDFTARRLSGLCLARFPVRTFKSASRPSLLPDAAPRLLRPWQGPGRAARSLRPPPHLVGRTRWGAPGGPAGRGGRRLESPAPAPHLPRS